MRERERERERRERVGGDKERKVDVEILFSQKDFERLSRVRGTRGDVRAGRRRRRE